MHYHTKRTSDFLVSLVSAPQVSTLTVGSIIKEAGSRVYGIMLILFGLPNILPIPGLPVLCGFILLFVGIQLILRKPTFWMPDFITTREISVQKLAQVIQKAFPFIQKVESFARPRLDMLSTETMFRVIGAVVAALAISLIIIPIPFVGSMPQGLAVVALGLGLIEKDGIIVAMGLILSLVASAVITGIALAIIKGWGVLF